MKDKILCGTLNTFQYMLAAVCVDDVFRWIELGLAILCSIVLLAYRIWVWYKKAAEDKKITADELKTLVNENKEEVLNIIDDIKDLSEDIKTTKNSKSEEKD